MFDGNDTDQTRWMALQMKDRLAEFEAERALASLEGLSANGAYISDLDDDLAAARHAYVGAAVTDIATLRGELSGPLLG